MSTKRKRKTPDRAEDQTEPEGPTLEQEDWDAVKGGELTPTDVPDIGDLRDRSVNQPKPDELPEEEDDNPYQESDEALPDDKEEAALARDPSKQKSRFDEV